MVSRIQTLLEFDPDRRLLSSLKLTITVSGSFGDCPLDGLATTLVAFLSKDRKRFLATVQDCDLERLRKVLRRDEHINGLYTFGETFGRKSQLQTSMLPVGARGLKFYLKASA